MTIDYGNQYILIKTKQQCWSSRKVLAKGNFTTSTKFGVLINKLCAWTLQSSLQAFVEFSVWDNIFDGAMQLQATELMLCWTNDSAEMPICESRKYKCMLTIPYHSQTNFWQGIQCFTTDFLNKTLGPDDCMVATYNTAKRSAGSTAIKYKQSECK